MPSTYTTFNGVEKPATGEKSGTWGTTINTNFDLIDEAIDGNVTISIGATTYSLAITDGASSNGRNKVVTFTGSPGGNCTVTVTPNDAEKWYIIRNNTSGGHSLIISQGAGTTVTILNGDTKIVHCNGGGSGADVSEITNLAAAGYLRLAGIKVNVSGYDNTKKQFVRYDGTDFTPQALVGGTVGGGAVTGAIPYTDGSGNLGVSSNVRIISSPFPGMDLGGIYIMTGTVDPNGYSAPVGSLYIRYGGLGVSGTGLYQCYTNDSSPTSYLWTRIISERG